MIKVRRGHRMIITLASLQIVMSQTNTGGWFLIILQIRLVWVKMTKAYLAFFFLWFPYMSDFPSFLGMITSNPAVWKQRNMMIRSLFYSEGIHRVIWLSSIKKWKSWNFNHFHFFIEERHFNWLGQSPQQKRRLLLQGFQNNQYQKSMKTLKTAPKEIVLFGFGSLSIKYKSAVQYLYGMMPVV